MKISKEFKIGAVVVCAIAAFVWGISFLRGSDLFSKNFYLYAIYPRIDGLIPATSLQVSGVKIGQVKTISLIDGDTTKLVLVKFVVTADIDIPANSIARVVSADFLGTKAVELVFNRKSKGLAKSGDTLIAESETGLKEEIDRRIAPLQAKANKLMGSIDSVMTVVNMVLNTKTRTNINESFEGVRRAILSLEQTAYKLDDMVEVEKPKFSHILNNLSGITSNLNKSEGKINNILNNFSNLSDSLAKSQLKSAIGNADKTLRELNVLITRINEGQGTLGKMAKNDSLYNNLNKSSANLEKLLMDLQTHPKRYVHFSIFGGRDKKPEPEKK